MMPVFFTKRGDVPIIPKLASDYAVGETVYIEEAGILTEYIIIHQGLPSELYDTSCDGTWLLRKDIHGSYVFGSGDKVAYSTSGINTYLNNTFSPVLPESIKSQIKTVKIPYYETYTSTSPSTGSSGFETQIFLLSQMEVGDSTGATDGTCLDYFSGSDAQTKRIANLNGSSASWYLRSAVFIDGQRYASSASFVMSSGTINRTSASSLYGVRPAFIIPFDVKFDPETNTIL